jgi:hypothetical protein
MFDLDGLAAVDPHADEAALIERIAWLEGGEVGGVGGSGAGGGGVG